MSRVDNDWCRRQVVFACRGHDSFELAAIAGVYVERARDEVTTHCMPYALKLRERIVRLPEMSRVDGADLESAALQGLYEAVGCYRISKGVLLTTHIHTWVRKRVIEARNEGHWAISRPPTQLAADYMAGRLDPAARAAYIDRYVRQVPIPGEDDGVDSSYFDTPGAMGMLYGGRG